MTPVNSEILVKKSLSVVEKLHFVQWNIFSQPSCIKRFLSAWLPISPKLATDHFYLTRPNPTHQLMDPKFQTDPTPWKSIKL